MKKQLIVLQLAIAALLLAGAALPVIAQTNRGAISGAVLDAAGAAVPNVKITARNAATGITAEAESTGDGAYRFQELPAGTYTLTATSQGFKTGEVRASLLSPSTLRSTSCRSRRGLRNNHGFS